ncbi:hypothetical protein DGo_PC0184 (plasmid) [Deinococcus gobiensis I-0]|uniref:Uncharacterized protein n=1 Tax=Deinococcus gobiensis (strain DSM 21396 / JCM 16679 / CGMCC 1.7299 / I-0) TaxID=745776 RepID=H8H379_DEIGI|nr:hypothetical protein DGo_PC0184 [Deinococcus gobiensis I-0]
MRFRSAGQDPINGAGVWAEGFAGRLGRCDRREYLNRRRRGQGRPWLSVRMRSAGGLSA